MGEDLQKIVKIHDFTYPQNVFGPSIKVRNALRKAIKRINLRDEKEITFLKRLVSQKEAVPLYCIDFSLGLSQTLHFLVEGLGIRRILFLSPVSPRLDPVFQALRRSDKIEFQDISLPTSTLSPNDLVYIEYPHGVRGIIFEPFRLFEVVQDLEERGVFSLIDDTLRFFSEIPSFANRVLDFRKVALLRDVGYFLGLSTTPVILIFSNSELIESLSPYLSLLIPPPFLLKAVREGIKQKRFRERVLNSLSEEKDYLREKFKKLDSVNVEDMGLDFLLFRSEVFDEGILRKLNEKGLIVRFFPEKEGGYIWYPIRKRRENALFARSLLEILKDRKFPSFHP